MIRLTEKSRNSHHCEVSNPQIRKMFLSLWMNWSSTRVAIRSRLVVHLSRRTCESTLIGELNQMSRFLEKSPNSDHHDVSDHVSKPNCLECACALWPEVASFSLPKQTWQPCEEEKYQRLRNLPHIIGHIFLNSLHQHGRRRSCTYFAKLTK